MSNPSPQAELEAHLDTLREKAGLKLWSDDGEDREWVGTQEQWSHFNRLWEQYTNE